MVFPLFPMMIPRRSPCRRRSRPRRSRFPGRRREFESGFRRARAMSHPARVRERARHVLRRGKSPELDVGDGRDEVRGDGDGVAIARDGDAFRVVIHLETKTRRLAERREGRFVPSQDASQSRFPAAIHDDLRDLSAEGKTGTRRRSDEPRRVHPAVAAADPERTLGVRDRRGRESETLGARTHLLELDDDAIVRDVGPAVFRTLDRAARVFERVVRAFSVFSRSLVHLRRDARVSTAFQLPAKIAAGAGAGAFADEIPRIPPVTRSGRRDGRRAPSRPPPERDASLAQQSLHRDARETHRHRRALQNHGGSVGLALDPRPRLRLDALRRGALRAHDQPVIPSRVHEPHGLARVPIVRCRVRITSVVVKRARVARGGSIPRRRRFGDAPDAIARRVVAPRRRRPDGARSLPRAWAIREVASGRRGLTSARIPSGRRRRTSARIPRRGPSGPSDGPSRGPSGPTRLAQQRRLASILAAVRLFHRLWAGACRTGAPRLRYRRETSSRAYREQSRRRRPTEGGVPCPTCTPPRTRPRTRPTRVATGACWTRRRADGVARKRDRRDRGFETRAARDPRRDRPTRAESRLRRVRRLGTVHLRRRRRWRADRASGRPSPGTSRCARGGGGVRGTVGARRAQQLHLRAREEDGRRVLERRGTRTIVRGVRVPRGGSSARVRRETWVVRAAGMRSRVTAGGARARTVARERRVSREIGASTRRVGRARAAGVSAIVPSVRRRVAGEGPHLGRLGRGRSTAETTAPASRSPRPRAPRPPSRASPARSRRWSFEGDRPRGGDRPRSRSRLRLRLVRRARSGRRSASSSSSSTTSTVVPLRARRWASSSAPASASSAGASSRPSRRGEPSLRRSSGTPASTSLSASAGCTGDSGVSRWAGSPPPA